MARGKQAELTPGSGSGTRACIQRYRARHKRINYVPSPEVLEIIDVWRVQRLDNCIAGVIDRLVYAGHLALAGAANSTQTGAVPSGQHVISGKEAPR